VRARWEDIERSTNNVATIASSIKPAVSNRRSANRWIPFFIYPRSSCPAIINSTFRSRMLLVFLAYDDANCLTMDLIFFTHAVQTTTPAQNSGVWFYQARHEYSAWNGSTRLVPLPFPASARVPIKNTLNRLFPVAFPECSSVERLRLVSWSVCCRSRLLRRLGFRERGPRTTFPWERSSAGLDHPHTLAS
jgi:hypothetical protein